MAKWDNFWQEKENETTEIKKEPLRETIAEDKLQEIRQIRRQLAAEAKKQEELKEKRLQEYGKELSLPLPETKEKDFSVMTQRDFTALPKRIFAAGKKEPGSDSTKPEAEKKGRKRKDSGKPKKPAAQKAETTMTVVQKEEKQKQVLKMAIACFLVAAVAFGGTQWMLYRQKQAIAQEVAAQLTVIEQKNTETLASMEEKIQSFVVEWQSITTALEEAGATIDSTGAENREAMAKRIEDLDKQLKSLEQSLNILREDKNGRQ